MNNLKFDLENEKIENIDKIIDFIKIEQKNEFSKIPAYIENFRLDALENTSYSIENLPKWLLYLFADILIRLTAIKQRTSSEIESVSVDTDILGITKINGIEWIKNYEEILKYYKNQI